MQLKDRLLWRKQQIKQLGSQKLANVRDSVQFTENDEKKVIEQKFSQIDGLTGKVKGTAGYPK